MVQVHVPVKGVEVRVLSPAFDKKPTQSKATTYYRDKAAQFAEANRNKEIVTQAEYDNLVGLVRSFASNKRAIEYLGGEGPVEVSIVWEDHTTGLCCKARIDKWQLEASIDATCAPCQARRSGQLL